MDFGCCDGFDRLMLEVCNCLIIVCELGLSV